MKDYRMYNKNDFLEIIDFCRSIIEKGEYETYGLRVQEEDTETVGEMMEHQSNDWEDEEMLDTKIDGVSTIGVDTVEQMSNYGGYFGSVAYLIGTNGYTEVGNDKGEIVIEKPMVLAKVTIENGEIKTASEEFNNLEDARKAFDEMCFDYNRSTMADRKGCEILLGRVDDNGDYEQIESYDGE